MPHQVRENGSIYVFRPTVLRECANRLGGRIAVHGMDYWSSFQLDRPQDVELLEWILGQPGYSLPVPWPDSIDLVVFDFDGVLTDNGVWVDQAGTEAVRCDRSDGWGIARLRELGVRILVLSTEANPVVTARSEKLKVPVLQAVADKGEALRDYLASESIDPARVVYVGNDENDLGCLEIVGLPVVVSDAHPSVRAVARHTLSRAGGRGAARELCDALRTHLESRPASER